MLFTDFFLFYIKLFLLNINKTSKRKIIPRYGNGLHIQYNTAH